MPKRTQPTQKEGTMKMRKYKTEENCYYGLRELALSVTPEELKSNLDDSKTCVYGVIMDWNLAGFLKTSDEDDVLTVVAFQTGDASLYFSSGTIIIGGRAHENIKSAALDFVREGQHHLQKAKLATETPLPDKGKVKFYLLTNKGKYVLEEKFENIENGKSDLFHFFELGNRVITEFRLITEKMEKDGN